MHKHSLWMIIGCIVPLFLIFLLPLFGITGNYTILIFIIAMFACHLMMMGKHGHHHSNQTVNKEDKSESHQH